MQGQRGTGGLGANDDVRGLFVSRSCPSTIFVHPSTVLSTFLPALLYVLPNPPPHCELVGGRVGFLSTHSGLRRPSFGLAHTHTHGRIQTHTDTVPLDRARIASHHIHRISTVFSPRPSSGLRCSACIVTLCPSIRTLHFQHPINSRGLTISPDLRSPAFFPRTRTRTRTGPNLSRAISRFSLQIKKNIDSSVTAKEGRKGLH